MSGSLWGRWRREGESKRWKGYENENGFERGKNEGLNRLNKLKNCKHL